MSAFGETFLARAPRVLGRKLRPFTLAHARALDLIESPFAGHEGKLDLSELYLAVEICRVDQPPNDLILHAPSGRLSRCRHWLRLLWLGRQFNESLSLFLAYQKAAQTGPPTWDSKGSDSGLPWYFRLASHLMAQGRSEAEAWSFSPGRAAWIVAGSLVAAGLETNLISSAEVDAMREAGYDA